MSVTISKTIGLIDSGVIIDALLTAKMLSSIENWVIMFMASE
jgi:hypothetical protein